MIKHNLKIAIRNLWKSKLTTAINLVGITIGLTTSLLLLIFVSHKLSTDSFFENNDRIYRIEREEREGRGGGFWLSQPSIEVIKDNVAEIEHITSFHRANTSHDIVTYKNSNYVLNDVVVANPDFFRVFSFKALYGDLLSSLENPNSIILSQSESERIFGKVNPVGKVIRLTSAGRKSGEYDMTVTGVFKNPPDNISIRCKNILSEKFLSNNKISYRNQRAWRSGNHLCYALLSKNISTTNATTSINKSIEESVPKEHKASQDKYCLQPLKELYFKEVPHWAEVIKSGNKSVVILLGVIGVLILVLAGINFFNLILTQLKKRLQTIGINKILGANRFNILVQSFLETSILIVLSFNFSLLFIELLLPYFNHLFDSHFTFSDIFTSTNLTVMLSTLACCILLFGLFPALLSSRKKLLSVIKGNINSQKTGFNFQYSMVIFQFVLTIGLNSCVLIMYKQQKFLLSSDYGFDKENIYCIKLSNDLRDETDFLEQEFSTLSGVKQIAYGFDYLGEWANGSGGIKLIAENQTLEVAYNLFPVYGKFVDLFGLEILQGQNFPENSNGENLALINQAFVEKYQIDNPINGQLKDWGNHTIIGVVEDFHYKSKHFPIEPIVFRYADYAKNIMYIKLNILDPLQAQKTIAGFEKIWKKVTQVYPFEGKFLDDHYDSIYRSETKFMKILISFSILAISLSCLGLFGISLFIIEMRTKEIGVRKVNGASSREIVLLLNKTFITKIFIAFVLASPLTYFLMQKWLQNFAYKTNLSWWIFCIAGITATLVAILSVSWQSWKAAKRNPIKSLRYE